MFTGVDNRSCNLEVILLNIIGCLRGPHNESRFLRRTTMTNVDQIVRYTTKDLDSIRDAVTRYSVGLDDVFNRLHSYGTNHPGGSYPPYNLIKDSNTEWRIEMALAGWDKDDISVTTESNILIIESIKSQPEQDAQYLHRGVANRSFTRGFNIADDVIVKDVQFSNGMLTISLEKVIPDHQKKKVYEIS